jgi:transcriptional regulator with XRE-family HTH domain
LLTAHSSAGEDEAIGAHFGREVRRVRRERGISVPELARLTGVDRRRLMKLEAGHARGLHVGALLRVAMALACDLADLLPEETRPKKAPTSDDLDDSEETHRLREVLGRNIRRLREEVPGLTLSSLATIAGIPRQTLLLVESGRVAPLTVGGMARLARALGISAAGLLAEDPSDAPVAGRSGEAPPIPVLPLPPPDVPLNPEADEDAPLLERVLVRAKRARKGARPPAGIGAIVEQARVLLDAGRPETAFAWLDEVIAALRSLRACLAEEYESAGGEPAAPAEEVKVDDRTPV